MMNLTALIVLLAVFTLAICFILIGPYSVEAGVQRSLVLAGIMAVLLLVLASLLQPKRRSTA